MQDVGVAAGAVFSVAQLLSDKQLNDRGFVVDIEHPEAGPRKTVGLPWKIGGTPVAEYRHSPLLGESNDYVFKDLLGLSDDTIDDLIRRGVIE